jgi:carbamoyltransferase
MTTLAVYAIPDPNENPPGDLHDHSLVLMDEGRVVELIELERISRRKHDNQLGSYLEDLVKTSSLRLPDQPRVVFVDSFAGRRFTTRTGLIHLEAEDKDNLASTPEPAVGRFMDYYDVEFLVCNHELAHVGSHLAFTGGFKDNSLLVHIDGGASNSNCSAWLYQNGSIRHLYHSWELKPHTTNFNVNPLSSAILGLPKGSNLQVAGKLMGYAAYGEANPELKAWLKRHDWFRDCDHDMSPFFEAAADDHHWFADSFDTRDQFLMDIAACIQKDMEDAVERFIFRFQEQTDARHLYYSGGVALNIKANSRLENSGVFESIHVPPCCSDTGLALGAASLVEFLTGGKVEKHSPFINSFGLKSYSYDPQFDVGDIAARIAQDKVIGICTGYGEVGPRALGHRSLIANPCSLELRDRISISMKKREWYRPLAPMVLRTEADRLFEGASSSALSRYMLGSYEVRPEVRTQIPGVVHVDGSARAQVVDENDPDLKLVVDLLTKLQDAHGIPCVINTSLNRSGEPIVHTHKEAMVAGQEMGIDALVLDNNLVSFP